MIVSNELWLLVVLALCISVLINMLFILKELIKKYPEIFTKEDK